MARGLAASLSALYLRIDTIEQAIRDAAGSHIIINEEGYRVAYAVAADNLSSGRTVIADSVNPVQESRDAWQQVALRASSLLLEVEVVCSDPATHRRRVETRTTDVAGLRVPTWAEVAAREYQPWNRDHLVIDTAHRSASQCVEELRTAFTRLWRREDV